MSVSSKSPLKIEELRRALSQGRLRFHKPKPVSDGAFEALTQLADAVNRENRFNHDILRAGVVWSLENDNSMLAEFDVLDERGRTRRAVPFWPAEKYASYSMDLAGFSGVAKRFDLFYFFDRLLCKELVERKLIAASFWIPGKRTRVDQPKRLAKELAELLAWQNGLVVEESISDKKYGAALTHALGASTRYGPKGKLP